MKKLSILTLSVSAMLLLVGASGASASQAIIKDGFATSVKRAAGDNTDVTVAKVSTGQGDWLGDTGAICINLNGLAEGKGFGVFSGATLENGAVQMFDKYGNETPLLYQLEGLGNDFIINRTKGTNYENQIVKIPAGLKVKMGSAWMGTCDYDGETITVTSESTFICKLANGTFGDWEALVNPTSLTLDTTNKAVQLGDTFKVTATAKGTTNANIYYHSSDTNIITVDDNGNVTAAGVGEATLTANCGTVKTSITVNVTSEAPTVQTGIKITQGKTLEVYKGESYSLSSLKAVKVYNTNPEGEEITITQDMISGDFDPNTAGTYTLTLTSDAFTDTFTVTVKEAGVVGIANLQKGYNFGNNSPWNNQFYFQVDQKTEADQYANVKDAALADVNNHIKLDGKTGIVKSLKSFHGQRYEIWFTDEAIASLKAGSVLTIDANTPMYYYSGTTDGNHEPQGDGLFQARNRLDKEYKFVYTGKDYEVYVGEPNELTIQNENMAVSIGEEVAIKYTVGPAGTYGTPTYSGYDETKISVSKDGKVSGIATGETTIVVTLGTISKTVNVSVLPAKEIKGFKFTNIPNYFSILKDSENVDIVSKLKTGKFVFEDDSESAEVNIDSATMKTTLDTSAVGNTTVEFEVSVNGKKYNATVEVSIYEYFDQKPSEVGIVDWFNYAVFFQFPKTSENAVNITGRNDEEIALLKEQTSKITYTRKDGTPVKINGGYELATNIAIFPEFLYEKKDSEGNVIHAGINDTNYNQEGYYEAGDVLTLEERVPMYKWTGLKGENDYPVAGTGEYIVEGYTSEKLVYKYNGSVWTSWVEYTDMEVKTKTLSIDVGKTGTIEASRVPDNATQGIFTYESSDPSVASVNAYGIVKGLKKGTATITITLKDEDDPSKTKTATCVVTVNDPIESIKFDQESYDVSKGTSEEDLLKQLSGTYMFASGTAGEKVDFTGATVTGYDSEKVGKQNITVSVTANGKTIVAKVTINVNEVSSGGCGGNIATTAVMAIALAAIGVGIVAISKKKKKTQK